MKSTVVVEGDLLVAPGDEVKKLPPDCRASLADRMRGERKIAIGLARLVRTGRIRFGHGEYSSTWARYVLGRCV